MLVQDIVVAESGLDLSANYDIASKEIYIDQDGNLDDYNWKALLGLIEYGTRWQKGRASVSTLPP